MRARFSAATFVVCEPLDRLVERSSHSGVELTKANCDVPETESRRLSVRGRLVGAARSPASLTLGGHVFVPTGNKDKATGEGKVLSLELFNKKYWQQDALEVAKAGLEKMKVAVKQALG